MKANPPRISDRNAKLECLKLAVSGLQPVSARYAGSSGSSAPAMHALLILETAKEFYEWIGEPSEDAAP